MNNITTTKTALVTGVSSGIGLVTAQYLAKQGVRVFGTVRNLQSASPIQGVELIQLDVTNDDSVRDGIQQVREKAGPIHWLVNNAGYALTGAAEETSIAEAKAQFETNFFGVLRVTNAVLPDMRRGGYGRIINISSVVGFLPAPYMALYTASKHAVEGYTWALDHEVREFDVRAALVQPAYTRSNISQNERTAQLALNEYALKRQRAKESTQKGIIKGDEPQLVAEAVFLAATENNPRLRYPVGKGILLSRLRRFLPASLFDRAIRKEAHLD